MLSWQGIGALISLLATLIFFIRHCEKGIEGDYLRSYGALAAAFIGLIAALSFMFFGLATEILRQ